jgi:hypothetical protein
VGALALAVAAHAQTGPPDMLKNATFKAAYMKALGPLAKERRLTKLDGPGPMNRMVKVAGVEYLLISACKPRDCFDHNTVLLWSAPRATLYGKVNQSGKATLLGAPPPAVAAELEHLWKSEWRQQQK